MSRLMLWGVIALVPFVISADEAPKADPKPAANVQGSAVQESQCAKAVKTLAKLRRPYRGPSFEGQPLREFLKGLSEASDIVFVTNPASFKAEGLERVEEHPVRLPSYRRPLTLGETLNYILVQVNGTFVIRGEYVEITTRRAPLFEFYSRWQFRSLFPGVELNEDADGILDQSTPDNRPISLAHVEYVNAPFETVVRDIAEQGGMNVMIVADDETKKRNVDARWTNVPADLAIRLLANSVNLSAVRFNKMLYICDHERATHIEEVYDRQIEKEQQSKANKAASPAAP